MHELQVPVQTAVFHAEVENNIYPVIVPQEIFAFQLKFKLLYLAPDYPQYLGGVFEVAVRDEVFYRSLVFGSSSLTRVPV